MLRKVGFIVALLSCLQFGNFVSAQSSQFMRGDHNQDRAINIGDAVGILGFLFSGGSAPLCEDASDINDDGSINIGDAVSLLGFLFSGGVSPAEPFLTWEADPTPDTLGCKPVMTIGGDITSDIVLTNDMTWVLEPTFVKDGVTMTIQAGTTIVGDNATQGFLVIERGGVLNAIGTANAPIVFTSGSDRGSRSAGDWGGIIVIGNGANNIPGGTALVEGLQNTTYGGGTSPIVDENSGTMSYVRCEFGGTEISPNNEINSITLASCGSGTNYDHVMCKSNLDDGFEWFGGGANLEFGICYGVDDDDFDGSFGWNGNVQNIVGIKNNFLDGANDRGFEFDGSELNFTDTPFTNATINNFTVIGEDTQGAQGADAGAVIRRGCQGTWTNGIVEGWADAGWDIDDAATTTNGVVTCDGITFANNNEDFETGDDETVASGYAYTTGELLQTTFTNNQFAGATSVLLSLDPSSDDFCRPDLSVVNGGINGTAYRGGVDPNAGSANWLRSMWVSWDDN